MDTDDHVVWSCRVEQRSQNIEDCWVTQLTADGRDEGHGRVAEGRKEEEERVLERGGDVWYAREGEGGNGYAERQQDVCRPRS